MSWKERGERERGGEKNAIYSGHLRLCQQPRAAHALRSDQNYEESSLPVRIKNINIIILWAEINFIN
jgi:hypothetical protein